MLHDILYWSNFSLGKKYAIFLLSRTVLQFEVKSLLILSYLETEKKGCALHLGTVNTLFPYGL